MSAPLQWIPAFSGNSTSRVRVAVELATLSPRFNLFVLHNEQLRLPP